MALFLPPDWQPSPKAIGAFLCTPVGFRAGLGGIKPIKQKKEGVTENEEEDGLVMNAVTSRAADLETNVGVGPHKTHALFCHGRWKGEWIRRISQDLRGAAQLKAQLCASFVQCSKAGWGEPWNRLQPSQRGILPLQVLKVRPTLPQLMGPTEKSSHEQGNPEKVQGNPEKVQGSPEKVLPDFWCISVPPER